VDHFFSLGVLVPESFDDDVGVCGSPMGGGASFTGEQELPQAATEFPEDDGYERCIAVSSISPGESVPISPAGGLPDPDVRPEVPEPWTVQRSSVKPKPRIRGAHDSTADRSFAFRNLANPEYTGANHLRDTAYHNSSKVVRLLQAVYCQSATEN
jgi:hypothetical protein